MDTLEVTLFGGFQLRLGQSVVPPMPSRAARSLFAALAVSRGTAHPRDRLAARFWPELPANRARRRLSHTLWQVQDALGELTDPADYLDVAPDTITFVADAPCTVDVERFEQGLDRARHRHSQGSDRVRDLTELGAVVELYRGEFLAGHTESWVLDEQERLHLRYVEALGWLIGLAKEHGAYGDALVYARRLTNEDPLREDAHREVMRLSVLQGRTEDALRQFERCREVLADELGAEPSAATLALVARISARRDAVESRVPPGPVVAVEAPFIGRDRERDRMVTVLERASGGRGGVLLLEGEPGVGVSRVLAEFADDADWRGCTLARVDVAPGQRLRAFGVVRELVAQLLTPLRLERLRPALAPVWLAELTPLIPDLGRLVTERPGTGNGLRADEQAQRIRDALAQVILTAAASEPTVLVVDGAHGTDRESLEVLEAVAAQLDDRSGLLVLGYRAGAARQDDVVWSALRAIDRRARPERIRLEPLDVFSSGELVRSLTRGRAVSPEALARVHRETGGNPLFVVETIRSLVEQDALELLDGRDAGGGELPVPSSIRELVAGRIERLAPEQRAVLDLVAVAGGEVEVATLTEAAELPREQVVDAADALVRRHLLEQRPTMLAMRHEQVRRAVVDALQPAVTRAIHRRLGEALEALQTDAPERLAHHFVEARLPARARAYLHRAARAAAAVHAYATADATYRRALDGAGGPQRVEDRATLLLEHEAVLDTLGERDRQRTTLEELERLVDADTARGIEVARRRALYHGQTGDTEAGLTVIAAAIERVQQARTAPDGRGGAGPDLYAGVLFARASILAWAGQQGESAAALRALLEEVPDAAVAAQAQVQLGSVLRELQRYTEARHVLESVLATAVARDDTRQEGAALGALGTVEMETGNGRAAIALYGRAIDRARTIGFRRAEGVHRVNRAVAHAMLGTAGAALADFAAASDIFRGLLDARGEAAVALNLAHLRHALLGDDDGAVALIEPALAFFRSQRDEVFVASALDTLAGVTLRRGELDRCRELLDEMETLLATTDGAGWVRAQLLRRRAEAEALEGRPEAAVASARAAVTAADELGLADESPVCRALLARLLLDTGDLDGAAEAIDSAVASLDVGLDRSYRVRLVEAEVAARRGERAHVRRALGAASEELDRVLASLSEEDRARAEQLAEVVRIRELRRELDARRVLVRVDRAPDGPSTAGQGRERLELTLDLIDPTSDDPVVARRQRLAALIADVAAAGGLASSQELATALEVSAATIRRDLAALRAEGHRLQGTRSARG